MKKIFLIVSIKDFLIIGFCKLFNLVLRILQYPGYYEPLLKLIHLYHQKGYQLSKKHQSLLIFGKNGFEGFKFLVRPNTCDSDVFLQVIEQQEYLPICKIIGARHLSDSIKIIVDAGANVGFTTIFFKKHFPAAKVICIEAEFFNARELKKNISLNTLENDVVILQNALWNSDDEILVINNDFRGGESWSKRVGIGSGEEQTAEKNKVKSVSLSRLIADYQLDHIDLLKIDIEGAEKELFSDASFICTISEKVSFIALEIHDEFGKRTQINEVLSDIQFELFSEGETSFYVNKKILP